VDVGLHDDGVQGLVDAAPAFQQGGEEAAGADFGDGQLQVAGLRGQCPLAVAVAPGRPGIGALAGLRADPRGRLRLDQFLQDPLGQRADEFETVRRT
jgi:hypothetical protein